MLPGQGMHRPLVRCKVWLLGGMAVLLMNAIGLADSSTQQFAVAKQSFMKGMKKANPAARVDAVSDFANVAQVGTAELLIKRGLIDEDERVRTATREGLQKLAVDSAVCDYLIGQLKKTVHKPASSELAIELLRAVLAVEDSDRQTEVAKFVEEMTSGAKANLLLPMTMIDEFAKQGDLAAVRSVETLSKVSIFETHFGYRRCVVQAMSAIKKREAIDFLIQFLPSTDGLVQHDIVRYLTMVTNQNFRDDAEGWSEWWHENRRKFEFPEKVDEDFELPLTNAVRSYYGIPICAKRVVFVLDTSGSMGGPPIDAAKQALNQTINSLPEAVKFSVVFFDTHATPWQTKLVSANEENKKHATMAVLSRGLGPATVSSAALEAAFRLDPEAIYFVSDGEPTDGAPAAIVSAVTQTNRTRRISIHTIGVAKHNRRGASGLSMFMRPLSGDNYGKFLMIE